VLVCTSRSLVDLLVHDGYDYGVTVFYTRKFSQENALVQSLNSNNNCCFVWSSSETANKENTRKICSPPPSIVKTLWGNQCGKHGTQKKNRFFTPHTSSTPICFSNMNSPQSLSSWNHCLLNPVGNDLPTSFMEWDSPSIINVFYATRRCLYFLKKKHSCFSCFLTYFIPLLLAFHTFLKWNICWTSSWLQCSR